MIPLPSRIAGLRWAATSQAGRQAIQIGVGLTLARRLAPDDFGCVAMAAVATGLLLMIRDLGLHAALVRHPDPSPALLSSVFWLHLAAGTAFCLLLVGIAPWVAGAFRTERVGPLLRALAVQFPIAGAALVHGALLEREMAFRTLARIEIAAAIAGGTAAIASACAGAGPWALVAQSLGASATAAALLWTRCPWRPGRQLRWAAIRSVGNFSASLTGFNLFNFLSRHLDDILVGRFLGDRALGYYALAYRFLMFPLQHVSDVFMRVLLPSYARTLADLPRLRDDVARATRAIALVTFPLMTGLAATAGPFVRTALGPAWEPVCPLLRILAPVGMLQSIVTTVGPIYLAAGRTDRMLRWGAFAGVATTAAFAVGIRYGLLGVAAAYAIVSAALFYPALAIPFRLVGMRVADVLLPLWRPLVCSLAMGAAVAALDRTLPDDLSDPARLALLTTSGAVAYAAGTAALNRVTALDILRSVRPA